MSRFLLVTAIVLLTGALLFGGVLLVHAAGPEVTCSIPNNVVCQVTDPDGIAAVRVTLDTAQGSVVVVDNTYETCETQVEVSWDPIVPNYQMETEDCAAETGGFVGLGSSLYSHSAGLNVLLGDGSVKLFDFGTSGREGLTTVLPEQHSWAVTMLPYMEQHEGWIELLSVSQSTSERAALRVSDEISITISLPDPTHDVEIYDGDALLLRLADVPDGTSVITIPEGFCSTFSEIFECIPTFSFHPDPFHGEDAFEITLKDLVFVSYDHGGTAGRVQASRLRFEANPDGGPRPVYDEMMIRGANLPQLELFDTLITPVPLPHALLLPAVQAAREAATSDPFHFDELTLFLEGEHEIGATCPTTYTDGPCYGAKVVARGTLIDEPVVELELAVPDEGIPDPDEPRAEAVPIDGQVLRLFNTATQLEFELTLNGDLLEELHRLATANSSSGASPPLEASSADVALTGGRRVPNMPDSLSDGIDNRALLTATTVWPWRTIVHFSNNCSGTLVGPRHILTSAHCVVQRGTNNWYSFSVAPGRNGDEKPYGDSPMDPNPAPGDPFRWYFTPAQYRDPIYNNTNCPAPCWAAFQWDWALIILPDSLGYQTGWMGYVARAAGQLNPQYHYNRGYPSCGSSIAPEDCEPASLYGDTGWCDLGNYSLAGSDGWNRVIRHDCDTSGGHSGSAVYHYFYDSQLGKTVPVVAMVHGWGHCNPCSSADEFPNSARRLRPADVSVISFFRNWKP